MKFKVVTFNVRIEGPDTFVNRSPLIVSKVRSSAPDIICFQELSHKMQKILMDELEGYFFVGGGRDSERLGESTAVTFKKNRFILSNCRTLWLSPTPDVPGTRFTEDQSGCPRVYTMVLLTDIETGETIRVYNTHLDHIGKKARISGIKQILSDMDSDSVTLSYPMILTGDMNATPNTQEILAITDSGFLRDLTCKYTKTFNNYGNPFRYWDADKIDYIFVSDEIRCISTELWDDRPNDKYLSDHYAISAELEI